MDRIFYGQRGDGTCIKAHLICSREKAYLQNENETNYSIDFRVK